MVLPLIDGTHSLLKTVKSINFVLGNHNYQKVGVIFTLSY